MTSGIPTHPPSPSSFTSFLPLSPTMTSTAMTTFCIHLAITRLRPTIKAIATASWTGEPLHVIALPFRSTLFHPAPIQSIPSHPTSVGCGQFCPAQSHPSVVSSVRLPLHHPIFPNDPLPLSTTTSTQNVCSVYLRFLQHAGKCIGRNTSVDRHHLWTVKFYPSYVSNPTQRTPLRIEAYIH